MKKIFLACIAFMAFLSAFASRADTIAIYSAAMHKNIKCVVIFPDSYFLHSNIKHSYPVVYLLHGYGDTYSGWIKNAPAVKGAVDVNQEIVVCPDGSINSWYFDSPKNPTSLYETFVAIEVPDFIDKHYRTIKNRKGRALGGLSMGGHGALYLAIRHLDRFGAAVSMSGGVDFTPFPKNWDIAKQLGPYEENKQLWEDNTVQHLVSKLKNNDLAISFECGTDDFFIHVNRNLHQKLMELKINHDYTERPGVHNWSYWNNAIPFQLLFLKKYFDRK